MDQSVIIIAGMHRSGTSLTGNLLEQSGLFIGEHLLSDGFDNKKGHFEDKEILRIHEKDLKQKGLDTRGLKGAISGQLQFEASTIAAIMQLLSKRNRHSLWGWKEPRTTLYLQAWKQQLPASKCLAVYRNYDAVAQSLLRRYRYKLKYGVGMSPLARWKHIIFYPLNIFLKKRDAYRAWYVYNRNIIDFKKKHPNDVIIVELSHLLQNYQTIIRHLNAQFECQLNPIDIGEIYDSTMLTTSESKSVIIRGFSRKKLMDILAQLKESALWI